MAFSGKSVFCLCFTFLLVIQIVSAFDVKKLCAIRCMQGRGGILCNCNAMHFTGKRSGSQLSKELVGTVLPSYETHGQNRYQNFAEDNVDRASFLRDIYGNIDPFNDRVDFTKEAGDLHKYLGGGIHGTALPTLAYGDDLEITNDLERIQEDERDRSKQGSLPLLLLEKTDVDAVNEDDGISERTRAEVVSKIKKLMKSMAQHNARDEDTNDLLGDERRSIAESKGSSNREHLTRLQKVLDQTLRGR